MGVGSNFDMLLLYSVSDAEASSVGEVEEKGKTNNSIGNPNWQQTENSITDDGSIEPPNQSSQLNFSSEDILSQG